MPEYAPDDEGGTLPKRFPLPYGKWSRVYERSREDLLLMFKLFKDGAKHEQEPSAAIRSQLAERLRRVADSLEG